MGGGDDADEIFLRVSFGLEEDAIEADNYSVDNWCFCKQSQNCKLMLCCDFCHTWYHADCVGISKVKVTKMMQDKEKYKCAFCKDKENEAKEEEKKHKLREYMGGAGSPNDQELAHHPRKREANDVEASETVQVASSSPLSANADSCSAEVTSSCADRNNVTQNGEHEAALVPTKSIKPENVVKVEADSTDVSELQNSAAVSVKSGVVTPKSSETAADVAANDDSCSSDEDEKLSDMKPMVLPPSPKDQKSKSAKDSSSDDSSDDSSSSSGDSSSSDDDSSSNSSSSEDDSSPVKKTPGKGKGEAAESVPKQSAAQRKRLNTLYKNSPKLELFCTVNLDRLAPNIVDRCAAGERLDIQEVNRLIEAHKKNVQKGAKASSSGGSGRDVAALEAVFSKKKSSALKLGADLKKLASDSDSSDDEKKVKRLMPPTLKSESKFRPAIKDESTDPIANIVSKKEPNEHSSGIAVKKEESEIKEEFSQEELIKAGLEVTTVPSSTSSAVVSFLEEKPPVSLESSTAISKKSSKARLASSSEDEYVEPENDSPKKTPSSKAKKEKKKKKVMRAPSSSSEDDLPKQIERKSNMSSGKASKGSSRMDDSDSYLEPVDDENKLRLLEEDLFKKPKKSKKEEKPTLSSTKPPSKIFRAVADAGQSSGREESYEKGSSPSKKSKSSKSSKSSSSMPSGSASGRRCIVPMCGKEVKLDGESNFCCKPCIKRHVQRFYDAVGYKKNKECTAESIQNPEVSSSQDRIRVRLIDKNANITVEGSNAPNVAEIYSWLRRNPTFEIVMPPKKQAEVDEQFRTQSKQTLRRKMIEVNSVGARMGRSIPGHTMQKVVDDFENVLWHFNDKEINKQYKECFARINHHIEANRDLLEWIVNGKLTSEHLVMMTDDEYKKVGTNKFISFTPQSDLFPHLRNKKSNFGNSNDILGRLTGDTTSGHGKTHEYSLQCKICKNSGEKSVLEAKEREKIRRKAEVKTLFSKHKNLTCSATCRFCSIAGAEQLRAEHDMRIGINGGKCDSVKCRFCELKELEEDYNANHNTFGQPVMRSDEVSNALSEQTQEDNTDDRLFGGGRVTGGAGLLNEVDDSAPLDAAPIDSGVSLNDAVDSGAAPSQLDNRPLSPPVPVPPQKTPRELYNAPASISSLEDGPPPLKKVAMSPPPPLKSLGGELAPSSPPPVLWEGNLILSEEKYFKVSLIPLQGMFKDIERDLKAQIVVKGRLEKENVFEYLRKVHSRQKLGIAVMEVGLPRDERERHLYRDHCEFLLAKDQLSGTAQNPQGIREMYILAVAANEPFPTDLGFHVNFRHPRRDLLLAIIIRNKTPNPNVVAPVSTRAPMRAAPASNFADERGCDKSNHAMRQQAHASDEKRMSDVYRNVISNPGRSVNEILSTVPVASRSSSAILPKPPTERLYPESNSSSFPFFREELMQSGSNSGPGVGPGSYDRGKRSSTEIEDSANWRKERADNYSRALSGSSGGTSVLGRFKDDHVRSVGSPATAEDRRSEDYLNQLYKPVERRAASPPPPLPPPEDTRPPLPTEPHPYHDDASKQMRLEYGGGGASMDDRRGPSPAIKRPAELMGYQGHTRSGVDIYSGNGGGGGGGDNRRMVSVLERTTSGLYGNGSHSRFNPRNPGSASGNVGAPRFRSYYN